MENRLWGRASALRCSMVWSHLAASKWHAAAYVLATVLSICVALWAQAAHAASELATYLPKVALADMFAGADHFGPPQGDPPIVSCLSRRSSAGARLSQFRFRQRCRILRKAD